jgi:hypothetical protein
LAPADSGSLDIAPPRSWGKVAVAAVLMLAFVLLGLSMAMTGDPNPVSLYEHLMEK